MCRVGSGGPLKLGHPETACQSLQSVHCDQMLFLSGFGILQVETVSKTQWLAVVVLILFLTLLGDQMFSLSGFGILKIETVLKTQWLAVAVVILFPTLLFPCQFHHLI